MGLRITSRIEVSNGSAVPCLFVVYFRLSSGHTVFVVIPCQRVRAFVVNERYSCISEVMVVFNVLSN